MKTELVLMAFMFFPTGALKYFTSVSILYKTHIFNVFKTRAK